MLRHTRRTEVDGSYRIGDYLSFTLKTGEHVDAMVVDESERGNVTLVTVDCLDEERPMNERPTNKGGYEASDLRKALNGEILESFPDELRERLIPFENGDYLRLPTEREMFGEEEYGDEESEDVYQWAPMENRRNRIALQDGRSAWYWLQNRAVATSTVFALVDANGGANADCASYSSGVRPAFRINNL